MSQIRLYVDEDAAEHALVRKLRRRGIEILPAVEAQMLSATDENQLAFAASQGRCMYSFNVRDFCRIHAEWLGRGDDHAGIIVIPRQRYSVGEKIRRLEELVDSSTAEQMQNRLMFL